MFRSKSLYGCILVGLLATQITSIASATLIAVKDIGDTGLDQTTDGGGAIHADFLTLTSSDIVNVTVNDTGFHDNTAANPFYGAAATLGAGQDDKLFKFDLASLTGFAGATINRAELRLWQTGGNNVINIARNLHHDVDQTLAHRNSPLGSGASTAPNGWGAASDAKFGAGDYGTLSSFDSSAAGAHYQVVDVTSDVVGFADGTLTNLGWAVISVNRIIATSEFGTDGQRPVLFLDYTVAVPEPSSFLLLGLTSFGLMAGKRRRV